MNELLDILLEFRKKRDWEKYHTPENLAKSIAIEAGELLECYQWDVENIRVENVKEELADVMLYCLYLANYYNLDVKKIMLEKIQKNELKYPVEKAKGNCKKYTDL